MHLEDQREDKKCVAQYGILHRIGQISYVITLLLSYLHQFILSGVFVLYLVDGWAAEYG